MLISSNKVIRDAYSQGRAVGSFNVSNLETIKGVTQAAEKTKSAVILAVTEKTITYAGLQYIFALMRAAAETSSAPIVIHLDHGRSLKVVERCLEMGFTSVMFDGSALSYDENIKKTKEAVKMAHFHDVTVEGELGRLKPDELTDPQLAQDFVAKTGIDFLAPAVGNVHGISPDEKIDLDRLKQINQTTKIPLVLHGGSGVLPLDIRQAIKSGVAKINIDTELRLAFIKTLKSALKKYPDCLDHREIMLPVITQIASVVEKKITFFNQ